MKLKKYINKIKNIKVITSVIIFILVILIIILSYIITIKLNNKNSYNEITKVGDKLYEVTFDKYMDNYKSVSMYLDSKYKETSKSGCSTIYKDGILLRNLDWYVKDQGIDVAELVIHTTASEGRYATIGVVNNPLITDNTYNTLTEEQMNILPFVIVDGMNSEGLMFGQNVVPEIDQISDTYGTNEEKENLNFYMLGRMILDNCKNVDEAIDYIKNHNIYMIKSYGKYRMESHIMLADKNRAVVVEFVNNQIVVLEQENLPDKTTYMTNHYLFNGGDNTGHGMGYERDKIIRDNYNSITNWKNGMKLLEKLKYTNAYNIPLGKDFWYSEYYVETNYNGKMNDFNKDTNTNDKDFIDYINYSKNRSNNKEADTWWTNHSSVYNSKDKTLHLAIRENYNKIFNFNLK